MGEAILSICAAALICALIRMLVPKERSSAIKLILSCFFAVSVIGALSRQAGLDPFSEIDDIFSQNEGYVDFGGEIKQMTAQETAQKLKEVISEELSKKNIVPKKIYIDVNISDSGRISITEVKLVFDSGDFELYSEEAARIVSKCTGGLTSVRCIAEGGS